MKELIAQEETAVQHNQELVAKHEDEKKKYETLLDEKLEIDEKLSISIKAFEETKEKIYIMFDINLYLTSQHHKLQYIYIYIF